MIRRFPDLESAYEAMTVIEERAARGLAIEIRDRSRWSPHRKILWCNRGDGSIPKYRAEAMNIDALTSDEAMETDRTFDWRALKRHDGLRGSRPIPAYRIEPSPVAPKRRGK